MTEMGKNTDYGPSQICSASLLWKKNNNGVSVGRTGKQLCVEVQYFVIHRIDILLQKL